MNEYESDNEEILTILEGCEGIVTYQQQLTQILSRGWFQLAKSRISKDYSCRIKSIDDIRFELAATRYIQGDKMISKAEDENITNVDNMMIIAAGLPDTSLRQAQKSFIASLDVILSLVKEYKAINKIVNPSIADNAEEALENNEVETNKSSPVGEKNSPINSSSGSSIERKKDIEEYEFVGKNDLSDSEEED